MSENEKVIQLTIAAPWWQQWWFRLLAGVGTLFLVFLIIRGYYTRKLEKQKTILEKQQAIEKERTRIATDMHDDFGASLSRIKFLSEKMKLQQSHQEKLKTDLEKISKYSDEMAEKMGEIVWALNQRFDSLDDLVSFCRSYATEYMEDKNIRLQFTSGQATTIFINGEIRRNVFLVIKEALHNVVKHSGASSVLVSMHFTSQLKVIIKDNGSGINKENIRPFANGIENMKKRMEEIGGTIIFKNEHGATITMQVPLHKNIYP